MKQLKTVWNNFKKEPDVWFFYAFLLTFTLSIRKVIHYYPLAGNFNEYTGIYLYLSDIFLFLTLLAFFYKSILEYKCSYLSILSFFPRFITSLFHGRLPKCSTDVAMNDPLKNTSVKNAEMSHLRKNVPCGTFYGAGVKHFFRDKRLIPLFALIAWSFASMIWSQIYQIGLFQSIKLLELSLLCLYIIFRIVSSQKECSTWNILRDRRRTISINSIKIIIGVGVTQSIIAIVQFLIQHSIGLNWLWESNIGQNIPGVAKFMFSGEKIIRAYGLFPHPNIIGGFLLVSIVLTVAYERMFHVEHATNQSLFSKSPSNSNFSALLFHPRRNVPCGTSYGAGVKHFLFDRKIMLINICLIIQIVAQMLTLSKSAIIGTILAISYLYYTLYVPPQKECSTPEGMFHPRRNVPRGTFCWTGMEHPMGQAWNILRGRRGTYLKNLLGHKKLWLSFLIVIVLIILVRPDTTSVLTQSLKERLTYINVSRGTISANPILGVGAGQFVQTMPNYTNLVLEPWQYQPVHNVFLLIWSELGIIGLGLFLWFLWNILIAKIYVPPKKEWFTPDGMFHACPAERFEDSAQIVPRETIYSKKGGSAGVEQFIPLRDGTFSFQLVFRSILLGFIFIMLFDHYLWDIQQGELLLWIVLGFLVGEYTS